MSDIPKGIKITNSETGQVWESGKRGRTPSWLATHPDYLKLIGGTAPGKNENKPDQNPSPAIATSGLKFYRWAGLEDMKATTLCYVAAESPARAIETLNEVFINPVGASEFRNMWKEIEPTEFMVKHPGVYEFRNENWSKKASLKAIHQAKLKAVAETASPD